MGQVIVVVGKLHDTGLWTHCVGVRSDSGCVVYAGMSGGSIAGEVRNPSMAGPFLQTRPCTLPPNRPTQDAKSLDTIITLHSYASCT